MNRVLCVVIIVLLVACGALSLGLNHYRDHAIIYKEQRDKKASELELANATITDMQIRQRDVAALDARYSRELADARAENETLRADVAAGRKRLRINANCPGSLRKAPITSGVDNATGPRLAEAAERDYFILRERLMAMQKQLEGVNRPGFPGEYFICELRLPDHYFRWKHNKLFLLLPEEYGPAFPAIVDCYTSPPT